MPVSCTVSPSLAATTCRSTGVFPGMSGTPFTTTAWRIVPWKVSPARLVAALINPEIMTGITVPAGTVAPFATCDDRAGAAAGDDGEPGPPERIFGLKTRRSTPGAAGGGAGCAVVAVGG